MCICILVAATSNVTAGPLEDANAAYGKKDFSKAASILSPLAESDNPAALFRLGYMYLRGEGVAADTKRGIDLISRASELNDPSALGFLASGYSDSEPAKAYGLWRRAAEIGDALAQYNVGNYLRFGIGGVARNDFEAFSWYRRAADQGFMEAQYSLGQSYQSGIGTTMNYSEAMRWFKIAAERGLAEAQERVAYMYLEGQGVTQDYAEAAKWQLRAAERGLALAQVKLGTMYMNSQGLTKDLVQAHKWINIALGSLPASEQALRKHAIEQLAAASKTMTPKQIELAQRLAREWRPK